jgi:hypothetical protein
VTTDTRQGHYRLEDARQAFEFDGELIAGPRDNRIDPKTGLRRPRYMVATLYLTDGGTFVLQRVQHSDVYHDLTGRCDPEGRVSRFWIRTPIRDLDASAVPCPVANAKLPRRQRCAPPLRSERAGITVQCERPRPRIDQLPGWGSLIQVVSQARHMRDGGRVSVVVTELLEALLLEAEENIGLQTGPKPVTRIA